MKWLTKTTEQLNLRTRLVDDGLCQFDIKRVLLTHHYFLGFRYYTNITTEEAIIYLPNSTKESGVNLCKDIEDSRELQIKFLEGDIEHGKWQPVSEDRPDDLIVTMHLDSYKQEDEITRYYSRNLIPKAMFSDIRNSGRDFNIDLIATLDERN